MLGLLLFGTLLGLASGLTCSDSEILCPPNDSWAPDGYCIPNVKVTDTVEAKKTRNPPLWNDLTGFLACALTWNLSSYFHSFQGYEWTDEYGELRSCPNYCSVDCDSETEKYCWGGLDYNGCSLGSFCQPYVSAILCFILILCLTTFCSRIFHFGKQFQDPKIVGDTLTIPCAKTIVPKTVDPRNNNVGEVKMILDVPSQISVFLWLTTVLVEPILP